MFKNKIYVNFIKLYIVTGGRLGVRVSVCAEGAAAAAGADDAGGVHAADLHRARRPALSHRHRPGQDHQQQRGDAPRRRRAVHRQDGEGDSGEIFSTNIFGLEDITYLPARTWPA